jgi:ribosome-associated translation inhibitor RaiA
MRLTEARGDAMKVQVNCDNQIAMKEPLSTFIEGEVERALERFKDRLTRVEVHVSDENSVTKGGVADKRCVIETRPTGLNPMTTSDSAATVEAAVTGASNKMKRLLESTFGKQAQK